MKLTLSLAADHGGYQLKEEIKRYLSETRENITLVDRGTHTLDSVHYPQYAALVIEDILDNDSDIGLLFCGTGIGMSIKANRHNGIRAAVTYDPFTAKMAKAHNNANILCLGGRTLTLEKTKKIVDTWLNTDFESGRHSTRTQMLDRE